jgi:hypothetical protein
MQEVLFRPFMSCPERVSVPRRYSYLKHPVFAMLGLRPIFAQHTSAEHRALQKWARNRHTIVEIGVAEGASAGALRECMQPDGTLYLIDPFHLSRLQAINLPKRIAQNVVGRRGNGKVVWIEKFSHEAVQTWERSIDLLFIDGNHEESAVRQDWSDWHRFVGVGGAVLFHDARLFENGWTCAADGPVRAVDTLFRINSVPGWRIVEELDSLVVIERQK